LDPPSPITPRYVPPPLFVFLLFGIPYRSCKITLPFCTYLFIFFHCRGHSLVLAFFFYFLAFLISLSTLGTILSFTLLSLPSSAQSKETTVKGELLDLDCYMASGAHGNDHKSCADMCIGGGAPMGVLTPQGKVYLLVAGHNKKEPYEEAKKHAGEEVSVTGTVTEKDGIKGIVVTDVKAKS